MKYNQHSGKFTKIFLSVFFLSFCLQDCYLHHANVSGDIYGVKNLVDIGSKKDINNLPIKLEFDVNEKSSIKDHLHKKGQNIKVEDEIINSYYSEEIISKMRGSKLFNHHPDANIKIRIFSTIEEVKEPVISWFGFIPTFGLFPLITRTYGRVEFEIFDSSKNTLVKTYKYPIHHRMFFGWAPIVLGPILPSFTERFDHSQNQRTFAIMRVAFHQFEKDLYTDIHNDASLKTKFFIDQSSFVALMPLTNIEEDHKVIYPIIFSELESAFLKRGVRLIERQNLDKVLNEIKFSSTGLTESSRNKIGTLLNADRVIAIENLNYTSSSKISSEVKFSFLIKCLEVKTGRIIWSQKINYSSFSAKDLNKHVEAAVYPLISDLRTKGEI
ncbi:hypothetical protein P3G55_16985 [Leptospira sp. 96542]|nr:hypothetical protein [Leptospira sp. 96542]